MSRRDAIRCDFSYEETANLTQHETAFSSAEEDTASAKFWPRLRTTAGFVDTRNH